MTITTLKSCTAYSSKMKSFQFVAETADYILMKNGGGVPMLLKPLNGGCVVSFQQSNIFN